MTQLCSISSSSAWHPADGRGRSCGDAFGAARRADGPHPKRNDQYKHQVEKLEQAWRTAQLNDDVDAMDKLLSDDYVGITMTGQVVTKTQQLDRMRTETWC